MNTFENVIGHQIVKDELRQILDGIKHREEYSARGVLVPMSVLLESESPEESVLLAEDFASLSDRKVIKVTKEDDSDAFEVALQKAREQLQDGTPSLVLVEGLVTCGDLNRYEKDLDAVGELLQAVKTKDVFVLASIKINGRTLNDTFLNPPRFDLKISVSGVSDECKAMRLTALLEDVPTDHVDPWDLVAMSTTRSHQIYEDWIRAAKLEASLLGRSILKPRDFVMAQIREEEPSVEDDTPLTKQQKFDTAVHEVGHLLMAEICEPGITGYVTIYRNYEALGRTFIRDEMKTEDTSALFAVGGEAAVEIFKGQNGYGIGEDFDKARRSIRHKFINEEIKFLPFAGERAGMSADSLSVGENYLVAYELERYVAKARELIVANRPFMEAATALLLQKNFLLASDIAKLKKDYPINDEAFHRFC